MNIQSTSLGLLGVSVGMGAIFSLAPVNPVYAGSFSRDILDDNGEKMGHMGFTWDDNMVGEDNMLKGFGSLTSFSVTDYDSMSYDLEFAQRHEVFDKFEFNTLNGWLNVYAYKRTAETRTRRYGFQIKSQDFDSPLIPANSIPSDVFLTNEDLLNGALRTNRYFVNLNLGEPTASDSTAPANSNSFMSNGARFVIPANNTAQSVPENSLTTALLIIAGLVFFNSRTIF